MGSKSFVYIDWEEALYWDGCPLCFLINKNIWRAEENFLYELVNDVKIREKVRESGGFCSEHMLQLLNFKDTLGVAIVIEDVIKNNVIPSLKNRRLPEDVNCMFCEKEKELLETYLSVLPEVLKEDKNISIFKKRDFGFCYPHERIIIERYPFLETIIKKDTLKSAEYIYGSYPWEKDYYNLFSKKLKVKGKF
ncbi:MAG: hypothetical protein CBR30_04575 [Dictyoglomus sp. NZ13-RE01]|nr:MAG: hypothetical protein CBR30_04575 [Dictyoglomus sp. NZ13-RE01]